MPYALLKTSGNLNFHVKTVVFLIHFIYEDAKYLLPRSSNYAQQGARSHGAFDFPSVVGSERNSVEPPSKADCNSRSDKSVGNKRYQLLYNAQRVKSILNLHPNYCHAKNLSPDYLDQPVLLL